MTPLSALTTPGGARGRTAPDPMTVAPPTFTWPAHMRRRMAREAS
jgi:hypothetical protein